jgi:hypothetical protein
MKQSIVEQFFKIMYPDLDIKIKNYELMPRFDFNEKGQFVEGDSAIFIDVITNSLFDEYLVGNELTQFTGYEFSITRC